MEQYPSNEHPTYKELTEPSTPALEPGATEVPLDPEVDNTKRNKLIKFGLAALTTTATFVAFRTGNLDSLPLAHSSWIEQGADSLMAGGFVAHTLHTVDTFRKK